MTGLKVDVAVVGGGLTGIAAAYFLAEAGGVAVALLERGPLAGGGTARAPGLVLTGLADHLNRVALGVGTDAAAAVWRFTVENGRLVRDLVLRRAIACGYEACGSYAVATNDAEARDLFASMEMIAKERIDCDATYVDRSTLAREPRAPRGLCAIRYGRDAAIDAQAFARGLAQALPRERVHVRDNAAVRALEPSAKGVHLETAAGEEVLAEIAVIAANAHAKELHAFFDGLVFPVRGQGFVTAPALRALDAAVSATWGHELYRQLPDGRIVAAGFRPGTTEEEVTFEETTTDVFQGFLERFLRQRLPALPEGLAIERRFAGICGFSQDGLPLLGPIPGQPKVLAACGFTMRGLSLAVAAGRAVARLATDGARDFPACLLPGRFL